MVTVGVVGQEALPECLAVRRAVFIQEQQVPEDLEVDGLDPEALHVLARDAAGRAVGTARLRVLEGGRAKVERVAVLAAARGAGVGARLMDALEAEARRRGLVQVDLSAQVPVLGFYAARGYEAHGPEFMDAGIPHRKMTLRLGAP
jgi:predicted GNAT family N-acyltransferase